MRKIPQQVVSLAIFFAAALAVLIVARMFLIPESFGKYGHYRADSVDEIRELPLRYAGSDACMECHDDVVETKDSSFHRDLSCEVCHGPAIEHINAPDEVTPDAPRDRGYCPICHGYNPSRPTGFPQIITDQHNPGKPCMKCHEPHNPVLPQTPEDCNACHREISNKKKVSHHSSVACVTCHTVEKGHLTTPDMVRAEKPSDRDFCGKCHKKGVNVSREIPRIDFDSHYHRYLCWDCHYPHNPEAR